MKSRYFVIAAVLVLVSLIAPAAFAQGTHSVQLTWSQSTTSGITANAVYRSTTTGGPYTKIWLSTAPALTWTDTAVAAGNYFYRVTALAGTIESAYSNEVAVVIIDVNPPTGVTAKQTQ